MGDRASPGQITAAFSALARERTASALSRGRIAGSASLPGEVARRGRCQFGAHDSGPAPRRWREAHRVDITAGGDGDYRRSVQGEGPMTLRPDLPSRPGWNVLPISFGQ